MSLGISSCPVATSGVFTIPKKVRTHVIYACDECIACLPPESFLLFIFETGSGVGVDISHTNWVRTEFGRR